MGTDGVIRGVSVGGPDFKETEGLGSKAKEPGFTDQFAGKQPPLALGDTIDAISGATITSRAVVDGVNESISKLNALLGTGGGMPASPRHNRRRPPARARRAARRTPASWGMAGLYWCG